MAKPTKYPRKLRQTLEKVAAARDERLAGKKEGFDPFDTFIREFLPSGSVSLMSTKIDEQLGQMKSTFVLSPRPRPEYVHARPPWEGETGASS
jgi:hypothetical protein